MNGTAWKPIDSAPKWKNLILGYFNCKGRFTYVIGRWLTDEEAAAAADYEEDDAKGGWHECIDNWNDYTHIPITKGDPICLALLPPALSKP